MEHIDVKIDLHNLFRRARITPRERQCIEERYIREYTLGTIAKEQGISSERVRQIIFAGFRKIRKANHGME